MSDGARKRANTWGRFGLRTLAGVALMIAAGCLQRRSAPFEQDAENRCTSCHGDSQRDADYLLRSAPPRDVSGATVPSSPGVGAHMLHLSSSSTHAAIACDECHRVPERADSPGHADDAGPADVVFGRLARNGARRPSYDALSQGCSKTWCHGASSDAVWSLPRTSDAACGSCHGLPPAAPHPQSALCHACHARVVDANNGFVRPALHVDGNVQYEAGDCSLCHGSVEDAAPPLDTLGNTARSAPGVGAHRVHLNGGAFGRPMACGECHVVPTTVEEPTHVDGLPAEVGLTGVAASHDRKPQWLRASLTCSDSWCHGPSAREGASPSWTSGGELTCSSCHGMPPELPHPSVENCALCHGAVVGADHRTIVERGRHVDGQVDVNVDDACTSCHGSLNPAPPPGLGGHVSTTFAGVGAHQAHLDPEGRGRAVPCTECHLVPSKSLDAGHIDSDRPAEVRFSGVATAFGASPNYENGACSQTLCHGAVFPHGHKSGATQPTPNWTLVDGSQVRCGSCHGLPPPRPHPYPTDCSTCHENVAPDNVNFTRPELHIDGVVTFTVP